MKHRRISQKLASLAAAALIAASAPRTASAAQWMAGVGAQSPDLGSQVQAFLPNEMWIHVGDSIVWTFVTNEIHTVTFLTDGHPRLPFPVGCPGFTANPATFTGLNCVTTPPLVKPESYTVMFTTAGNYKLVCLVHENMTATIHVLASSAVLPHNQDFYDKEAKREKDALLSDEGDHGDHRDRSRAEGGHHHRGDSRDQDRAREPDHERSPPVGGLRQAPGLVDEFVLERFAVRHMTSPGPRSCD